MTKERVYWGSRLGVVLAVAGSAVGLGNFLRFPGQAAQNGGGAFMIPYFIALLLVGIPLAWAEWSMGRYAGTNGFHSAPGIFASLCKTKWASFMGMLALLIPLMIYTYYIIIEAWCLGYAWHYLSGNLNLGNDADAYGKFFQTFTGQNGNGTAVDMNQTSVLIFVLITFVLNFILIRRGINKGIETFCKFAMPLMIFCAVCVLIRVLTLGTPDPDLPGQSVAGGLNFMWNPEWEALLLPNTWLAAAGQIFFSLSVGFGVIINYASYIRKKEDIALSGLTATATNEFFEVCLGGLITLPAAFIFLGTAAGGFGTFGLGFVALPNVFSAMPYGQLFGFLWYFMLFLAAITSSLSMLQPVIAFFEEGLGVSRTTAALVLGGISAIGSAFVFYYSANLSALDNIDFWAGTFLIVVLATLQSVIYGWVFGIQRGKEELSRGALIKVPDFVFFVLKYLTPVFLLIILGATIYNSGPGYIENIQNDDVARRSVYLILSVAGLLLAAIAYAIFRWSKQGKFNWPTDSDSTTN